MIARQLKKKVDIKQRKRKRNKGENREVKELA